VAIPKYGNKFKATINAWINVWGISDLPVLFVELANFQYSKNYSNLGGSREALPQFIAQQQKAAELPGVHGVTITDISNYTDIHPNEKASVGIRLGNAALGYVYAKNIVPKAATFKEMRSEGNALRVSFHNNSGFNIKSGTVLNEFKIAGSDNIYKNATAIISENDILVSEVTITEPLSVKFAWDEDAKPNLFNGSQSPASRFFKSLKANRITFNSLPGELNVDQTEIQLQATALSGLPVTFASSNPEVASVEGNVLKIKAVGSVVITASEKGNTEYAAAPDVQQNIQVVSQTGIETNNINSVKVTLLNNNMLRIEGLEGKTNITLLNQKGQIVITSYSNENVCNLKVDKIPVGTYIVSVTGSTGRTTQKLNLY
ncbi:MAG: T9SS type A sorting domain-containing protein, partial [Bacteroidales bacterium]|nr:T9SS type A sorting domain-containing protein [Bacteroidales bacterium]